MRSGNATSCARRGRLGATSVSQRDSLRPSLSVSSSPAPQSLSPHRSLAPPSPPPVPSLLDGTGDLRRNVQKLQARPQALCSTGLRSPDGTCCAASCGKCSSTSAQRGCSLLPGGRRLCCASEIHKNAIPCVFPTDDGCVLQKTLCAAGIHSPDGACCPASCGACSVSGTRGCSKLPGGRALCCASKIRQNGRACVFPFDVGCVVPRQLNTTRSAAQDGKRGGTSGAQRGDHEVTSDSRRDRHTVQATPQPKLFLCSAGLRSPDGACCATSCGTCTRATAHKGCSDRPGGRKFCCSSFIRRYGRGCVLPTDVGCVHDANQRPFAGGVKPENMSRYQRRAARNSTAERTYRRLRIGWRNSLIVKHNLTNQTWLTSDGATVGSIHFNKTSTLLAVGLYAPSCAEAITAFRVCIGCASNGHAVELVRTLAMIDEPDTPLPPFCVPRGTMRGTSGRVGAAGRRRGADYVIASSSVLPEGVEARTGLANFNKSVALFGALVTQVPDASWYIKVDADTLLNVPQLLLVLAAERGRVDYLGKAMFLFDFHEGQTHFHVEPPQQFTYMQGGMCTLQMFEHETVAVRGCGPHDANLPRSTLGTCTVLADVLSRRAAVTVASCPRRGGPWHACPNRYFTDVSNPRIGGAMERSCVRKGATDSSMEDFLVGACVAEAGRVALRTHQCVVNQGYREEIFAEAGYWKDIFRHEYMKQLCACPVAFHSIKDPIQLHRIGRLVQDECVAACGEAVHAPDSICSLYTQGRAAHTPPPPPPLPPSPAAAPSPPPETARHITTGAVLSIGLALVFVVAFAIRKEVS